MLTKCINTAARATWNHSVVLAGRTKQFSNSTLIFKARCYMDCYICGIYNMGRIVPTNERCITVHMFAQAVTNTKLKTQQNLQKKRHENVYFVLNAFVKKKWKIIIGKSIMRISRGLSVKFTVVNPGVEMFNDHIKWHNIYSKNEYYMKPEKLEELLNICSALRCYTGGTRRTRRET